MPQASDILNGLHSIANNYYLAAILWHIAAYVLLALLIAKWKPSNKILGTLLSLPLLSVAVFAWSSGNPFNGFLFSVLTFIIMVSGLRIVPGMLSLSKNPFIFFGILMVAFGLLYPHFLDHCSLIKYLYASPFGLIPCPTLSVIIGFALIYNSFGSRAIALTLILSGLFYGFFGVLKLAVYLDLFLVFGASSLMIKYILSLKHTAK